jgi:hypothetical protein
MDYLRGVWRGRILLGGALSLWLAACSIAPIIAPTMPAPTRVTSTVVASEPVADAKPVAFAVLEDYDKGQELAGIELDFQLMNELEIHELRCSFGWDDYEPAPGQYDFVWLKEFVALAAHYGIRLRPYIGYTPPWAGAADSDGVAWNNPPASEQAWYDFVYNLALALRDYPNVLSYEVYNEENTRMWWDGTVAQYGTVLRLAAQAVRAADADAQVLLGGLVYPDGDWLLALIEGGHAQHYDVVPFHAYPETWTEPGTVVENYLDAHHYDSFVLTNNLGEAEPIWINEMGFATTPGRTEEQQANWFARAVSTFLAEPEIEQIGIYEIKDLAQGREMIGDDTNYYLGLTRADRTKKLAFYTVDLLTDLLDTGAIIPADDEATVQVTAGTAGELYHHLFKRPEGSQVLFVYDKRAAPTVQVTLATPGQKAIRYELDGSAAPHTAFDGTTLAGVSLQPGQVAIFRISP